LVRSDEPIGVALFADDPEHVPGGALEAAPAALRQHPGRDDFAKARAATGVYHYPVAILFGTIAPSARGMEDNCGLQVILFHPQTAETVRVHFEWSEGEPRRALLCYGEVGDAPAV
jgi:hypothetical protein